MRDLAALSLDDFTPLLCTNFNLDLGQSAVSLQLTEAYPLKRQNGHQGTRTPFSLTFKGPLQPELPQGTYRLSNEEKFQNDLFIVPVARNSESMIYQAIFN